MSAISWKALLAGTAAVGAALVAGGEVQAQVQPEQFAQVNALSDLSDVQPTDWYFQALQSLVERYGCIAGYPDGTYRGQRAMTRGEFAAGLNACLDVINQLIAEGLADKVTKDDLAVVQRLQDEFAAELAALKGRVDALEAKTAELEANPLGLNATTSKLGFEVISGIFAASEPDDVTNNVQVPYRIRMNFDTSFSGEDQLRVRLQSREANQFSTNIEDRSTAAALTFSGNSSGNEDDSEDVELDDVYYRFPLFDGRVTGLFGINSIASTDLVLFATPFDGLSDWGDGGSDLVWDGLGEQAVMFSWEAVEDLFYVTYGYAAEGEGNDRNEGFFAGPSQHSLELAATPVDSLLLSLAGTSTAVDPSSDSTDDFFSVGFGFTWEIVPWAIFSGWYAHAFETDGIDDTDDWLVGFAFPDLFIEGSNGGFMVGSPDFFVAKDRGDDDTLDSAGDMPIQAEVYYSFPLTENLTITPGVYYISNVDGDDEDIVVGGVRTTFKF
ncbi:MAG: iron uptake porin [Synechococcus sp.]